MPAKSLVVNIGGSMLARILHQRAREIGFDFAGIAPLEPGKDLEFSRAWVERGYGGEMRYLENPKRRDPRSILPSAKSVVCVGLVYNTPFPYSTDVQSRQNNAFITENQHAEGRTGQPREDDAGAAGSPSTIDREGAGAGPRAWISRYSWGDDYHRVMHDKLERLRAAMEALSPSVQTRVYVDTGPVVERAFARLSGIGWMGKNTCLINESKGSWFFLGVILTSLDLEPDWPAPDRCGSCTRCLEACPTGALVEPYVMDASRCIAYLTIELKTSIPEPLRAPMGNNVFGCDICQDVCPWNRPGPFLPRSFDSASPPTPTLSGHPGGREHRSVATTAIPEFQPRGEARKRTDNPPPQAAEDEGSGAESVSLFNPPLEDLAALSEDGFCRRFAASPVKRVKYRGWLRNLAVAMGNSGDRRFVGWLEKAREYPDSMVREHVEWALNKLLT